MQYPPQITLEQLQDNKLLIETSLNKIIHHSNDYTKREIIQKIIFIEELVEEL